MKKILIFVANLALCIGVANAAVRDGTAVSRTSGSAVTNTTATQHRKSTTVARKTTPRTTALTPRNSASTSGRSATRTPTARPAATTTARTATRPQTASPIVARATNVPDISNTRTGAEYERCKNTYFSCMDQFCSLKNDDYRRCSCNDRVFQLSAVRDTLNDAGEQLTVFTENLDVVGMTAEQATAMRTESEGEIALTDDNSASKALLQAIMNSIRGDDATVGGKYADLNSINIAFDTVNAFGMTDVGQAIAAYNGNALYNAVYPQCRSAVRADCNDASLQRAITAYLMAIEQDCNTVQTALEEKQNKMKSAVREGSAMLDLARIENRKKHNSSDITTCINEVENAILSEQVCGANYHKCLDNGEYIDTSTGKPIAGVEDFYKLGQMLVFSDGVEAAEQQLSKNSSNRKFVQNFEARVKKFAEPALDKCVENRDVVWAEYLDKALLSIYYAQQSKVSEIKQDCFDYVSACYVNGDTAINAALSELSGSIGIVLQPDKVALNSKMCSDYVESCNNMFAGDIIRDYINTQQTTDTLAACRAVVKQCFDKYGGANYENFYYPYSGLYKADSEFAPDWFALYEYVDGADGKPVPKTDSNGNIVYKSECARQLQKITACSDPDMIVNAFGGLDVMTGFRAIEENALVLLPAYFYTSPATADAKTVYGILNSELTNYTNAENGTANGQGYALQHRYLRPTGVATEVYNQILSILSTQCTNLQGRFIEIQNIPIGLYDPQNYCLATFGDANGTGAYSSFVEPYGIGDGENMCPRDYTLGVATKSWGACLCWENGGRRSKWGKSAKCVSALPVANTVNDANCNNYVQNDVQTATSDTSTDNWCTQTEISGLNQVCPIGAKSIVITEESDDAGELYPYCKDDAGNDITGLPEGLK